MRTRARLLTFAVPLGIMTAVCWGAWADDSGRGDDHGQMRPDEPLVLKKKIDVGGKGLGAFDISFVDPKIELYVLADRTNASVDLIDSEDANFIGRVGVRVPTGNPAPHFCFQGVVLNADGSANNNLSGPTASSLSDHKEIWAGDGDSRIKVIDIATKSFITTISTGGTAGLTKWPMIHATTYSPPPTMRIPRPSSRSSIRCTRRFWASSRSPRRTLASTPKTVSNNRNGLQILACSTSLSHRSAAQRRWAVFP